MTPERIEELGRLASEAKRSDGWNTIAVEVNALVELLAIAKSAIPSGQVAEDEALLKAAIPAATLTGHEEPALRAALSRLAAQAQSALYAWERQADRDRHAQIAEVWRKRVEQAADALADVLPGEVGRLNLLARIAELKRQRDGRERDLMLHFEAKNAALRHVADLEAERDALREQLARLSAAGQILSEHVDKAPACEGEPDCGWHNGGPCEACKRATGRNLRDEFAKAAMQVVMDWLNRTGEAWTNDEAARRAYAMADAMLSERAKP